MTQSRQERYLCALAAWRLYFNEFSHGLAVVGTFILSLWMLPTARLRNARNSGGYYRDRNLIEPNCAVSQSRLDLALPPKYVSAY